MAFPATPLAPTGTADPQPGYRFILSTSTPGSSPPTTGQLWPRGNAG